MKRKILSLMAAAAISSAAIAATGSFTISQTGQSAFVLSTGQADAYSFFTVSSRHMKPYGLSGNHNLNGLSYQLATYPDAISHVAQICYTQAGSSSPVRCIEKQGGTSGSTDEFNRYRFGLGTRITITHMIKAKPGRNVRPDSRKETLTFNVKY